MNEWKPIVIKQSGDDIIEGVGDVCWPYGGDIKERGI